MIMNRLREMTVRTRQFEDFASGGGRARQLLCHDYSLFTEVEILTHASGGL